MQDNENMDSENKKLVVTEQTKTNSHSRRSFFKKAAVGSALITTVTSRPVWAGQCTLSGNLSNNNSNQTVTTQCTLSGYSSGGWRLNDNNGGGAAREYYGTMVGLGGATINANSSIQVLFGTSAPNITIQNALSRTTDVGTITKQLLKQITAAALNAALWQLAISYCDVNSSTADQSECASIINKLDDRFYWPKTVEDYKSDYSLVSEKSSPEQRDYASTLDALYF